MKYSAHNVLTDNPHLQSLAALVLLTQTLVLLTHKQSPKPKEYRVWLRYRKWVLKEYMLDHKKLYCHYCGRGPLKAQSRSNHDIATLDHVKPISKNGERFHTSNIVIACFSCNNRKADKDLDQFISNFV